MAVDMISERGSCRTVSTEMVFGGAGTEGRAQHWDAGGLESSSHHLQLYQCLSLLIRYETYIPIKLGGVRASTPALVPLIISILSGTSLPSFPALTSSREVAGHQRPVNRPSFSGGWQSQGGHHPFFLPFAGWKIKTKMITLAECTIMNKHLAQVNGKIKMVLI